MAGPAATAAGAAAALPATLTHREATATLASLAAAFGSPGAGEVRLDASALRQFDTSAIAVLLECRRLAQQRGRTLRIDGLPAPLLELARLYGVEELLTSGRASSAT
ncbi:STAS domain-containing protein [Calidifontimicrobium sp. SYSU G02091]|uniref:STAS domain-containing protein n=1 Tax=Calidifontimicrobium sp. SYSU G02091 TaxID=2926421 RepID=UPI001F53A1D0|nr:STAS domain-containing protein [Calidifontimicrobium sp. SYSU G02091]MCI1190463.1 STAS domain-containing protein [Calidifontimicrobium sp. SYSU G02091]